MIEQSDPDPVNALDRALEVARNAAEVAAEHDIAARIASIIRSRASGRDAVYTAAMLASAFRRLGKSTTRREASKWIAQCGAGYQRTPASAGKRGSAWLITRSAVAEKWPWLAETLESIDPAE